MSVAVNETTLVIVLVAVFILVVAVVLFPVFLTSNSFEPASVKEARDFAYATGKAIKQYARDHNGRPPESLDTLYPAYTSDARVSYATVRFGGELATLDYRRPSSLGNARTLVLEIRWVDRRGKRGLRPVRLWGDLHRPKAM